MKLCTIAQAERFPAPQFPVFELRQSGKEGKWFMAQIYTFTGGDDGGNPQSTLVFDNEGNLYGTTYYGGLRMQV